MKKNKLFCSVILLGLLLVSQLLFAQPMQYDARFVDSITKRLPASPDDTSKVNNLATLAAMHLFINPALTIQYAKEGAAIAEKIHFHTGRIRCLGQSAFSYAISGEWVKATMDVNEAIPLCEKYNQGSLVYMCNLMVIILGTKGDNEQALQWAQKATRVPGFSARTEVEKWPTYMQLGRINEALNRLDSANYYADIISGYIKKYAPAEPQLTRESYTLLGNIALKQKQYPEATAYYRLAANPIGLAAVYHVIKQPDSAIYYGLSGLQMAQVEKNPASIQAVSKILAAEFSKSNPGEANKYLNIYIDSRDSLYNADKLKQLEEIKLNGQRNEYELQIKDTAARSRLMLSSLFIILASLAVLILLIWRNNRFKQRANQKLEASFNNLKSAQAQLIQSEKMASLGELTAGIAHEIQNPLNFVNNFSEVNKELIEELKGERQKAEGERNIQLENELLDDIEQNLDKINHHGKRADAIVKGMLQHSRSSNGVKEPTDINALCDEYLRLAYNGLRAKDKSFNATLKTDFDHTIGNINIIPQDIGRVVLNLINNAFYAATERRTLSEAEVSRSAASLPSPSGIGINSGGFLDSDSKHNPIVSVSTKKSGDKVLISVKDNGPGIPEKILDKIFQPFFTTKPTGQGTGLGLSLSYDIVKAHGGELKVETKVGIGSEFTIKIPVS